MLRRIHTHLDNFCNSVPNLWLGAIDSSRIDVLQKKQKASDCSLQVSGERANKYLPLIGRSIVS
jgi:hypothetical protein